MKLLKFARLLVIATAFSGFAACSQKGANQEETATAAKITDKAYLCPMHCEGSASDQPGKCPVCDMELKKNPDYVGEYTAPVSASADTTQTGSLPDSTQNE